MVPVAPDHPLDIVDREILPLLVADMLPARDFLEHQESHLITRIKKVWRLRVVRRPHDIALEIFAKNPGVASLHARGHRLPHEGKCLMPVQPPQLQMLSVEEEPVWCEFRLAKSNARAVLIDEAIAG